MKGHAEKCVERCCELAHHSVEDDLEIVEELADAVAQMVLMCQYLAQIGWPDMSWTINAFAEAVCSGEEEEQESCGISRFRKPRISNREESLPKSKEKSQVVQINRKTDADYRWCMQEKHPHVRNNGKFGSYGQWTKENPQWDAAAKAGGGSEISGTLSKPQPEGPTRYPRVNILNLDKFHGTRMNYQSVQRATVIQAPSSFSPATSP